MHFNFAASEHFDLKSLSSVEDFIDSYPDFQAVWLADENEFNLLLDVMGIDNPIGIDLDNATFCKYWDLSSFKLPELDNGQFDIFYDNWLQRSNRDTSMNEYGSLIFLQGLTTKWNKLKYRIVVKEDNNGS